MKAKNGQWTVDGYCFQQLPKYPKEGPNINIGLHNYITMCANMKMFSRCLVAARSNSTIDVFVQPYEKEFPSEFDIFRAGYEFCYSFFPTAKYNLLGYREKDFEKAEMEMIQHQDCNDTPTAQAINLAQQHLAAKSPEYKTSACNCFVDYFKCWSTAYETRIFGPSEWMHVYYFARLGGECLKNRNVSNKIVTSFIPCGKPSISRATTLELSACFGIVSAAAIFIAHWLEASSFKPTSENL